jgi:hypothetical protein
MTLDARIRRLETSLARQDASRIWLICVGAEESDAAALVRHGIQPVPHDLTVALRYGQCVRCMAKREGNL